LFIVTLLGIVLIELFPAYNRAAEKIDLGNQSNVEANVFKENELTKYLNGRSQTDRLLVLGKESQSNHYAFFHPLINGYSAIKTQLIQDINEHSLYKANTEERINWNIINMLNGKYIIADGLIDKEFLKRSASSQSAGQVLYENLNALPKAWFVKNVKYFETPEDIIFYMNDTTFNPAGEALLLNTDQLSVNSYSAQGSINIEDFTPNRLSLSLETGEPQLLVVSELYYPAGWKAFLDGEEINIYKTNHLLRGMEIPAGAHKLEFVIETNTYSMAMTLSWIGNIVSILLLFTLGYFQFFSEKK
jgi:hypothetical protein